MSARPGRLIDVVATGWPRERDSGVLGMFSSLEVKVLYPT
jgi:hypothetical protein